MTSHDITYVGIIQTARASGMEKFPLPYVLTNCHNSLCAVGGTINEDDHMFGLTAAKKYGTKIVRRNTGGGTVYHDLNNINFSFCFNEGEYIQEFFTDKILSFLHSLNISAEADGRNDIIANGKKISGCAMMVKNGFMLFHGTLLFSANTPIMEQLLNVDCDKLRSKGISSVKSRVGSICDYLPKNESAESFMNKLKSFLSEKFNTENAELNRYEIEKLVKEKYGTWEWNIGKNPKMNFLNRKRFTAGSICINAEIKNGIIKECRFTGDFIGKNEIEALENALVGTAYKRETVGGFFRSHNINNYLGMISEEQWLLLFFPFE